MLLTLAELTEPFPYFEMNHLQFFLKKEQN